MQPKGFDEAAPEMRIQHLGGWPRTVRSRRVRDFDSGSTRKHADRLFEAARPRRATVLDGAGRNL